MDKHTSIILKLRSQLKRKERVIRGLRAKHQQVINKLHGYTLQAQRGAATKANKPPVKQNSIKSMWEDASTSYSEALDRLTTSVERSSRALASRATARQSDTRRSRPAFSLLNTSTETPPPPNPRFTSVQEASSALQRQLSPDWGNLQFNTMAVAPHLDTSPTPTPGGENGLRPSRTGDTVQVRIAPRWDNPVTYTTAIIQEDGSLRTVESEAEGPGF